jgi:hypothetical protein
MGVLADFALYLLRAAVLEDREHEDEVYTGSPAASEFDQGISRQYSFQELTSFFFEA